MSSTSNAARALAQARWSARRAPCPATGDLFPETEHGDAQPQVARNSSSRGVAISNRPRDPAEPASAPQARPCRGEGAERGRVQAAIDAVADKAERLAPGFQARATELLREYARGRALINPEHFADWAAERGCVPHDGRAFGTVWRHAARDGLVELSDVPYRRRHGNGSPGLLWRSKVA